MGKLLRDIDLPRARETRTSFGDAFDPRSNGFGFLRLALAAVVVFSHAWLITGIGPDVVAPPGPDDPMWGWTKHQEFLGGLAVAGFFVISGFLITRSAERSRSLADFAWRRFLRIMPGFWACLVVSAFVVAPVAWHHSQGDWQGVLSVADSPVDYVVQNSTLWIRQWGVDGVFDQLPAKDAGVDPQLNGSLWTLRYEVVCYFGIALLAIVSLRRWRRPALVVAGAAGLWLVELLHEVAPNVVSRIPVISDGALSRLAFLFMLGAALYVLRDRVPSDPRLAGLAAAVVVGTLVTGGYTVLGLPALAYLCLWTAFVLPIRSFERHGDYSYGLYIYAFPIQQLLALYGFSRFGWLASALVALILSLGAAYLSWHLVEKRALALKGWQWWAPAREPAPASA